MSSANIVDINARRPLSDAGNASSDAASAALKLLASLRDLASSQLTPAVVRAFSEIDDVLFEMSEKAPDGNLRQQYFDDVRALRRTRDGAAERFDGALRSAFTLYGNGRQLLKASNPAEATEAELSLVDEGELELSLALSRIAARCDESATRPRLELTRRLQHLFRRAEADTLMPLSGAMIAEFVKVAVASLPIGIGSRLVLLKRIERGVADGSTDAVQDGNKLLYEAGVLPEIKLTYARRASEPTRPAAEAPAVPAPQLAAAPQIDLGALASEITRLLTASRPRQPSSDGQAPEVDATAADKKLSQLRDPGTLDSNQFAQAVRGMLSAGPNGQPGASTLAEPVENAIDLVSLMFDFVARDESLPREVQQSLTPLRMPLLRSALRGAQLFNGSEHPLRALMESAAEIGRSWSADSDRDGRVLGQIKSAVANAVAESELDPEGVERVQQDLRAFIAGEQKRSQLLEKRSAEAAQAQERRIAAQRTSQQTIAEVLDQTPVPPVVGTLLNGPLRRHLELVHARRGEDSKDWKSAKKLVRDIVWSFDPETISVERAHWQAMLPNIVTALRGALTAVGMHDNDIDGVVVEFRNRYRDLVAATQLAPGATPDSFTRIDPETMPDAPAPQVDAEAEMPPAEIIEHAAKTGITYGDALDKVRNLVVGNWVELLDGKGETQRAKLIWNSAISQRCLFVNRNGQMIADRTFQNLASEWMLGHLKPIEEAPLFQRALEAVKLRLVTAQRSRAA
ncbi:MAG: DUF1631 family protein [Xanthomonadales bacterium]|nr:DUF1631 family protein [Xanthomonadales bacterium]MBK7145891.1 DUF1631 family protein [Xanthomonadales bacterium]MCC6559832.1 DUF1631 family protein [Xanthomonadales bacterium]